MNLLRKIFTRSSSHPGKKKQFYAGASDTGIIRKNNEDSFLINPDYELYIVADGMGGHNAGEVASQQATRVLNDSFSPLTLKDLSGQQQDIKNKMITALCLANKEIYATSLTDRRLRGMGCTVVYGLCHNNTMHICHVGDARAYHWSAGRLSLLTTDHSYVMTLVKSGKMTMEEARTSVLKNELCQAVGTDRPVNPDYIACSLEDGDIILFCSDGLWDMLSDREICDILGRDYSAAKLCAELIARANKNGGKDNITVIAVIHAKSMSLT